MLSQAGVEVETNALISDNLLKGKYSFGRYQRWELCRAYVSRVLLLLFRRHEFDLVWMEIEALPGLPLWLERWLLRGSKIVLDYDDAVFHRYSSHPSFFIRWLLRGKLKSLMRTSTCTIVGNAYLAAYARTAGAPEVTVLPTVVDLTRYREESRRELAERSTLRIAWIGSPATVHYLDNITEALQAISREFDMSVRIIGGACVSMPGIPTETVEWSEASEIQLLRECDIGIMPLLDAPFERGKCGYKLIQYMALGLPVVASPVGVNTDIVRPGENGYLATSNEDWFESLRFLLASPSERRNLGERGRQLVEQHYSLQIRGPELVALLQHMGGRLS